MKIDDLIVKLEEFRRQYGNIDVGAWPYDGQMIYSATIDGEMDLTLHEDQEIIVKLRNPEHLTERRTFLMFGSS